MTTSNVAAADKTASNVGSDGAGSDKTGADKSHEKLIEKRRALGRGLESLLPGPRVVVAAPTPSASSGQALPQSPRDGAPLGTEPAAVSGTVVVLQAAASGQSADGEAVSLLGIDQIDLNPYQTRRKFEPEALRELSESIAVQGVLQPIVVRPGDDGRFILILGERRLRASARLGNATIPAIVKRVSNQQAAEMTLVENLQRQDLNCMEQAEAFSNLSKNFKMTQEDIGKRAGVSREQVSNYMRLLSLPEGVIGALQTGKLTYSHARTLVHLRDHERIWKFAKRAIEEKMSVERLQELVLGRIMPAASGAPKTSGGARWQDPNVKAAQRRLEEVLGMRVRIRDRNGRGKILIEYSTLEDFDLVVGMLKGK